MKEHTQRVAEVRERLREYIDSQDNSAAGRNNLVNAAIEQGEKHGLKLWSQSDAKARVSNAHSSLQYILSGGSAYRWVLDLWESALDFLEVPDQPDPAEVTSDIPLSFEDLARRVIVLEDEMAKLHEDMGIE